MKGLAPHPKTSCSRKNESQKLENICKNLIEVQPMQRLAPHPETRCSASTDDRQGRTSQGGAFEKGLKEKKLLGQSHHDI